MKTSVIGYPRVGALRELKFASEKYFRGEISQTELEKTAKALRAAHWRSQSTHGVDFIPSNDFSFYDNTLDIAFLLNIVPKRYQALNLSPLDTCFAMARGYQGARGDVKALAMKKWFNTNYHYMVPEVDDDTVIQLAGTKPFDEFLEAKALDIKTKPVLIGAFTLLKLIRFTGRQNIAEVSGDIAKAYAGILAKFDMLGAEWVQLDEPYLVKDLTEQDIVLFESLYRAILAEKGKAKVLLQTYFGDLRDCYKRAAALDFDGIGLDFVEGKKTLELVRENGFPQDKVLFAGLINGKNIWRNHYAASLCVLEELQKAGTLPVLSTSCSLLHVPYTLENETKLSGTYKKHLSFAAEKLSELSDLQEIMADAAPQKNPKYLANVALFSESRTCVNSSVQAKLRALSKEDFTRQPGFAEREKIQKRALHLPFLPTTTIGSFPQTADVKANRTAFRKGTVSEAAYKQFNKKKIAACVDLQEKLGFDVLVHGEFERNDMVEYFGERLRGYLFTEKAWVQSYGTRCVKPPVIWGDISREKPITVEWSAYAQSLTGKPVKGMLTGPVTILNWSFPREDIALAECACQLALAIREEVLDLEANGIRVIQIDEAALREKLPLRKSDWESEYLSWAIPAFRFVHSGVKPETQIHTHMCYSEFDDIIKAIDDMDADVISFEASRSDLTILDTLKDSHFRTEVGPGVYDIHSPRVPSTEEIKAALYKMLEKIPAAKLWVNPDCGLKTRGNRETRASLENLVEATRQVRAENGWNR